MLNFNRSRHVMSNETKEIRVQVKLTNAIDEELFYRGLLNPDQIYTCEVQALVGTGHVRSVIPIKVLDKLGLSIRTYETSNYIDDRQEKVGVSEPIIIELQGRKTTRGALVAGDEVIIGLTALETLDLVVDYENLRLIPNPRHPDYPVFRI